MEYFGRASSPLTRKPALHIEGCDCLEVKLDASLSPLFQGLQSDEERALLRQLQQYFFHQTLIGGLPIRFASEDWQRYVENATNSALERERRKSDASGIGF
jgi:hypothetical protein